MTINEAYQYVIMEAIKTVGDICQKIEILPLRRSTITSGNLPKQKYINICFQHCNDDLINKLENQIVKKGIHFDITGQKGFRSWVLDWSFILLQQYQFEPNVTC